jgi:hypothetical protein
MNTEHWWNDADKLEKSVFRVHNMKHAEGVQV